MANEVDICKLALTHIGDSANVASISPPEGSVQAQRCATYYPIARDTLLEMHDWTFARHRRALAELTNDSDEWDFMYALPSEMLTPQSVIPPEATNELIASSTYIPQAFSVATSAGGVNVIYTNQEDAILLYTKRVTDPTKFSTIFQLALSWLLASLLAGPLIKGKAGAAESERCLKTMSGVLGQAKMHDGRHRQVTRTVIPKHIANR